ncbi:hypothetical protein AB0L67_37440 [Streptomyces flaveolus]|uniref:hypothetical protein n=1 Tax=Streptomyces flaveolus TaxID=67297 RepID=UPI003430F122
MPGDPAARLAAQGVQCLVLGSRSGRSTCAETIVLERWEARCISANAVSASGSAYRSRSMR